MSISTCCKAKFHIDTGIEYNGDEPEEYIRYICISCGQRCAIYDPPCDTCGSMDPCSCADFILSEKNDH